MDKIKEFLNKKVYENITVGTVALVGLAGVILYPIVKKFLNK